MKMNEEKIKKFLKDCYEEDGFFDRKNMIRKLFNYKPENAHDDFRINVMQYWYWEVDHDVLREDWFHIMEHVFDERDELRKTSCAKFLKNIQTFCIQFINVCFERVKSNKEKTK